MSLNRHRQHNMDIERIFLALFVIVAHFNHRDMGGALNYVSEGPVQEILIRFTESVVMCTIQCYILQSGYFAEAFGRSSSLSAAAGSRVGGKKVIHTSDTKTKIRLPYKKAILLLATCSFYRVTGYIAYVAFISHDFSVKTFIGYLIPSNWFACLFVTLLLLSPFIGRLTEAMDDEAFDLLTALLLILFVAVPTMTTLGSALGGVNLNGLATVTFMGDVSGFNIALFVTMYVLGMWICRRAEYLNRFSAWTYFTAFVLFAILITAISHITETVWDYSDILVVCEAVTFTLMFMRIRSFGERAGSSSSVKAGETTDVNAGGSSSNGGNPDRSSARDGNSDRSPARIGNSDRSLARSERIGKVITALAGCSYGVFIWHTMPVMIFGLWPHLDIPGHFASGSDAGSILGCFASAVMSMYILSLIWVLTCRLVRMKISSILFTRNK